MSVLVDLVYPFVAGLGSFGGEYESSLCVVPVFLPILPECCIMSFIVIFAKLFLDDFATEEFVVFKHASSIVSD